MSACKGAVEISRRMTTWQIILVCIVLLAAGLVRQVIALRQGQTRIQLTVDFLNRFIEWCNGNGEDHSLYNWMLSKSEMVQGMMGGSGLVNLRRPFESGYHENVPVVLNALLEIEREFRGRRDGRVIETFSHMVDVCLRRFIGLAEEQHRREMIRTWNPLVLFCGGVSWLMDLPLLILSETKLISARRRDVISEGRVFSVLKAVATLAGLVAAVMSIVMGWDNFWKVVLGWIR